jgi:hypothetical protein
VGGEETVIFVRCINDLLQIGRGEGNGLFTDDVLAAGHRLNGKGLVKLVGNGDDDKVNGLVRKNLLYLIIKQSHPMSISAMRSGNRC